MKTIGIIGGMSWESSAEYYRLANEKVKARLGTTHSADLVLVSLDFHPIAQLELKERWDELADVLIRSIGRAERAGAAFVIMASNTVHKVADVVQQSIDLPLLHIADATAAELKNAGITRAGLLGTRFVMEQDFYTRRFRTRGIDVVLPTRPDREYVHDVIYHELCAGKLIADSKDKTLAIMRNLERQGAEAVVLACTELPLLIKPEDTPLRLVDTVSVHVDKAVAFALAE